MGYRVRWFDANWARSAGGQWDPIETSCMCSNTSFSRLILPSFRQHTEHFKTHTSHICTRYTQYSIRVTIITGYWITKWFSSSRKKPSQLPAKTDNDSQNCTNMAKLPSKSRENLPESQVAASSSHLPQNIGYRPSGPDLWGSLRQCSSGPLPSPASGSRSWKLH